MRDLLQIKLSEKKKIYIYYNFFFDIWYLKTLCIFMHRFFSRNDFLHIGHHVHGLMALKLLPVLCDYQNIGFDHKLKCFFIILLFKSCTPSVGGLTSTIKSYSYDQFWKVWIYTRLFFIISPSRKPHPPLYSKDKLNYIKINAIISVLTKWQLEKKNYNKLLK